MGWIGDHSGHLGEEKLVRLVYLTFAGGSDGIWGEGGEKIYVLPSPRLIEKIVVQSIDMEREGYSGNGGEHT